MYHTIVHVRRHKVLLSLSVSKVAVLNIKYKCSTGYQPMTDVDTSYPTMVCRVSSCQPFHHLSTSDQKTYFVRLRILVNISKCRDTRDFSAIHIVALYIYCINVFVTNIV